MNNILGLKNNAAVPTRELIGGPGEYHYTYDDLYRLTSATGTFRGREDVHRYSLNMSYNSVGSILQKVQRHESTEGDDEGWEVEEETTYDLTYAYSTEQPHAPVRIGKEAYGYDANGNMTSRRQVTSGEQRKLHWDEENRLRVVYDDDDDHHYLYDAAGE